MILPILEFGVISLLFQIRERQGSKTKKEAWEIKKHNSFPPPHPYPRCYSHNIQDSLEHLQFLFFWSSSQPAETCTFANHLVIGTAVSPGQAVLRAVTSIVFISYFSASVLSTLPAASWNRHNKTLSLLLTNQMKEATIAYKRCQQKELKSHII